MKLTKAAIENATYEGKSYRTKGGRGTWTKQIIWDDVVEGLGVRIFPTARKTFVLTYREDGKKRTRTLGKFGPLTLDEARKQAREVLESIGGAPTPAPVAAPAAAAAVVGGSGTFAELAEAYLDQQLEERGSAALADQRLVRLHINPVLGRVALSQVRPADLWRLRTQVARRYPSDARRLSNLVRLMFKWASDQGLWQALPQGDASESSDRPSEDSSSKDERAGSASLEPREPPQETDLPKEPDANEEEAADASTAAPRAEASASETPVLARSQKTEPEAETGEDLQDLGAVRRQLELELTSTRSKLKGERKRAETKELELREQFDEAENRANTLSLSVQQLQDWRREAESEQESFSRQLEEASEREEALTQEVATLTQALWEERVERDRIRSQLEATPPPAPRAEVVAAAMPARRPSVLWLVAALGLGVLLGALLVADFPTAPESSSSELQVATARPPVTTRVADAALASGSAPLEVPAGSSSSIGDEVANDAEEAAEGEETAGERSPEEPGATNESVESPDLAGLEATVRAWAASWSGQRVDDYLAFYSRSFDPPGRLTRGEWEEQRRSRILRPSGIRVSVGAITSAVLAPDTVRANFVQAYSTESYSDETRKTLVLAWEEGAWKITDERSE